MSRSIPPEVVAAAQASQRKWDVPASVCLAQWALESGWGAHAPGNNPFGIKARPGEPSLTLMTWEVIGGRNERMPQRFRRFTTIAEAFDAHGSLLARGAAFARARMARHDAEAFAHALTGHYATDPDYGSKLVTLMRSMGVEHADVAAKATPPAGPDDILRIQAALNRLGTNPALAIDGVLGPKTCAAIRAFQNRHGLEPDGRADPETVAAIVGTTAA